MRPINECAPAFQTFKKSLTGFVVSAALRNR